MNRNIPLSTAALSIALLTTAGCSSSNSSGGPEPTLPDVSKATFVNGIDNPYFPFPVGASWTYQATTDEGIEQIDVFVTAQTRQIQGVTATVVHDTVTLNGEIIEDTYDWYAQDSEGNVWYLGEDSCEYENGECVDTVGSWEWGVDGALPGIAMPANPTVNGEPYYQEYYPGEAEDVGEVISTGETASVPAGTYTDCVRTHDTSTLDRNLDEEKVFCRGIGNVAVYEPDATEELVSTNQ